jgi:hypothetical protein
MKHSYQIFRILHQSNYLTLKKIKKITKIIKIIFRIRIIHYLIVRIFEDILILESSK